MIANFSVACNKFYAKTVFDEFLITKIVVITNARISITLYEK